VFHKIEPGYADGMKVDLPESPRRGLAVTRHAKVRARRIAGFGLTTTNAGRLAEFYSAAFGCRCGPSERLEGAAFERLMGVAGGAQRQWLTAGDEIIELLQFDRPGAPYPPNPSPLERTFQHFALVVADMHRALLRLEGIPGWAPISSAGPQRLPASSGGVTAFKFRDPDGHPLEFLEFPAAQTPARWRQHTGTAGILGIDHSAISVADSARSVAFYRDLGFSPTAHTLNHGKEQSALDGIPHPEVEVTALTAHHSAPHLELLCYRSDAARGNGATAANDVAATRLTIEIDILDTHAAPQALVRDPDGHRLQLLT
jgi:catechol 2,3-dioxygenase-like lactoylglutathione lyase family enzyme